MKHDYECDRHQATIYSEGYGNPHIEPTDYACYCPAPGPTKVTITVHSPDEDGDYCVDVESDSRDQAWTTRFSNELAEILPDSKEVKEWLRRTP